MDHVAGQALIPLLPFFTGEFDNGAWKALLQNLP
jgi:hypothetical protein